MSKSKSQIKKLPTIQPQDVLKVELAPPELKKVELPPAKPIYVNLGFWETLWLLITSVLRNKARDAMEGKPISVGEVTPPRLLANLAGLLTGSWWKLGVAIFGVCLLSFVLYYIYSLIFS